MSSVVIPDLHEIMDAVVYRPAVSIIMPFEPKMSARAELTLRLRSAVDKVQQELKADYPGDIVDLMMGKLNKLVSALNFSTHKRSIAIYVSPVFEKVLYLEVEVNEKIIIDDTLEIRDVVYNKKQQRSFLVLLLTEKQTRIYLGSLNSLTRISTNSSDSVYAFVNDAPEKVSNFSDSESRREVVMDKFLVQIDNDLEIILNSYQHPLFVLGTKKIIGHFKKLTRHSGSVVEYINGSYADLAEKELADLLHQHTEQWEKIELKNLVNKLEDAADKKKLAVGIKDVWKDAMNRKGRLLVVEKDYMYAAQRGNLKGAIYMPAKPYSRFSNVKDAVDDVIQTVFGKWRRCGVC